MPCGWEGNRRSGVALAMRHRLQWFIHLPAQNLRKGDKHPASTPRGCGALYSFILQGNTSIKAMVMVSYAVKKVETCMFLYQAKSIVI